MPNPDELPTDPGARDLAALLTQVDALLARNPALAAPLRAALERRATPLVNGHIGGWLGGRLGAVSRAEIDRAIDDRIWRLVQPVTEDGRPNHNALNDIVCEIAMMRLAIKALGEDLARRAYEPAGAAGKPPPKPMPWKPCTRADLVSDWVRNWILALKHEPMISRGHWQWAYVLQVLEDSGMLAPGRRGLGFGCGKEMLPSYLASRGVEVLATDLPLRHLDRSIWRNATAAADDLHHAELVPRAEFDRLVTVDHVDMNAIPPTLAGFDFCWSVCSMEHVGSIAGAMAFVENSLATVKPGGVAIHTSEINVNAAGPTSNNDPIAMPQRADFEALAAKLAAAGHEVGPLDFDFGDSAIDRFIDVPPYLNGMDPAIRAQWPGGNPHIKISVYGFPATPFGLWVRRRP
jgi:SAM-dependent methyltransferase